MPPEAQADHDASSTQVSPPELLGNHTKAEPSIPPPEGHATEASTPAAREVTPTSSSMATPAATPSMAGNAPTLSLGGRLQELFTLNREISAARALHVTPGAPAWDSLSLARGYYEAAVALVSRSMTLTRSDGTAAAWALLQQANSWLTEAHLKNAELTLVGGTAQERWLQASRLPLVQQALQGVPSEELQIAEQAWLETTPSRAAQLPVEERSHAVRSLRALFDALADPLIEQSSRLGILYLIRAVRIGLAVLLLLALVGVGATVLKRFHPPNIALNKLTSTSSLFNEYRSSQGAVDGDTITLGFHTDFQEDPWLLIDLGSMHPIHEVIVYNRSDCCTDRAVPMIIEVSPDGIRFTQVARKEEIFTRWDATFQSTQARFVRVKVKKKTFLHLAEVEVY